MRQDYFFVSATTGEYTTTDIPIYVNCGGLTEMEEPFKTRIAHGRCDYTLYYLHKGQLTVSFGQRPSVTLNAGAIIVIPPNTRIEYSHDITEPIEIYWAHFTGGYVTEILEGNNIPKDGCIYPIPVSLIAAQAFQAFLDEMKNQPDTSTRQRAASKLILALTTLTQLLDDSSRYRRLQRSFAYIQEHFTENISKTELAEMENLGISQYYRLFQQCTGLTPSKYITKLRINLACKLLDDLTLSINDVAEACGYDDMFYFSRVFSREFGVCPSQYRKGIRGINTPL